MRAADVLPTVALVIAAHNEEDVIEAKLENALALDYPRDRLRIIVASDASSDRTDELVRALRRPRRRARRSARAAARSTPRT